MSRFALLGLAPDYSEIHTAADGARDFDIEFKGPGIYHGAKGDVLLVLPIGRKPDQTWHSKFSPDERFEFAVYNRRNPADVINLLCNMPTRDDSLQEAPEPVKPIPPGYFPGDEEDGTRGRMYAEECRNERRP